MQPHALVVYESMFGSTRAVAQAVQRGLARDLDVELLEVADAPDALDPSVALLVVAAPTHAFGLSRPSTRQSAATQTQEPLVSRGRGVREWLGALAPPGPGHPTCAAAAVDTRLGKHWVPGSAARGVEHRLRHLGFRVVAGAESFWVRRTPGELRPGELERAEQWAARLAATTVHEHATRSWEAEPVPPPRRTRHDRTTTAG